MDSNYYDEERIINEMNEAMDYDPDIGYNDASDYSNDPYWYLSNYDLKDKVKNLTRLELKDFLELPIISTIKGIEYLGWSTFSRDYISFHFAIQEKYYHSCIHTKAFLENNFEFLKKKNTIVLEYNGIKKNSKGQKYPAVYMSFLLE